MKLKYKGREYVMLASLFDASGHTHAFFQRWLKRSAVETLTLQGTQLTALRFHGLIKQNTPIVVLLEADMVIDIVGRYNATAPKYPAAVPAWLETQSDVFIIASDEDNEKDELVAEESPPLTVTPERVLCGISSWLEVSFEPAFVENATMSEMFERYGRWFVKVVPNDTVNEFYICTNTNEKCSVQVVNAYSKRLRLSPNNNNNNNSDIL